MRDEMKPYENNSMGDKWRFKKKTHTVVLLMAEILHHLGCMNPYK